jgi:protein-disulfide isomerase
VKVLSSVAVLFLAACSSSVAYSQQPATTSPAPTAVASSPLQKSIEAYLRYLYAFGPGVEVRVGTPKDTEVPGLQEVNIEVKIEGNTENAKFFVSKDGKYLLRGDLSDTTKDPLAETRAKLETNDSPSLGDPKAAITLVEFSDFECPVCRNLHDGLRGILPNYPAVRIVFKDFPLEQIHPWARTAAIAGRCAYQQDPKAFWKMYDLIYDGQDLISAANAWGKMVDFAGQAGVNAEVFKACMASPEAAAAIEASRANGMKLEVGSTPTIFVNGRRIVGADSRLIEQYINYELAQLAGTKSAEIKGSGKK